MRTENAFDHPILKGRASGLTFVDVFAGCGGLSLGLMRSGWTGLFAVEKDRMAFATISKNLFEKHPRFRFSWPDWLDKKPLTIEELILKHEDALKRLRDRVDLLAGGPPCQGFSSAGRRMQNDPRNKMLAHYLTIVELIAPKVVLIENVPGITYDFNPEGKRGRTRNFSDELKQSLSKNYDVFASFVRAPDFGIPQVRRRYIIIGFLKGHLISPNTDPFFELSLHLPAFREQRGLSSLPRCQDAISDFELARSGTKPSLDTPGFEEIIGSAPETLYQNLMRDGHNSPATDTRLARHNPDIIKRFTRLIRLCKRTNRLHVQLSQKMREDFGLKKKATRVMDPSRPSPTITSMPDDLIHYSEPRTLTVRENARLQSFPDWYEFEGKYTTGGMRRRNEVPRFTQVANAVPPLLAEAIGEVLVRIIERRAEVSVVTKALAEAV